MGAKARGSGEGFWRVTVPRVVLGALFAGAALNYFWQVLLGWPLIPQPITPRGLKFAAGIIEIGYLWPFMKAVNLFAGILLIANRLPAVALLLLAPVTVIIVWFQIFLNPLPVPLATVAVILLCESLLFRAFVRVYAPLLAPVELSNQHR